MVGTLNLHSVTVSNSKTVSNSESVSVEIMLCYYYYVTCQIQNWTLNKQHSCDSEAIYHEEISGINYFK